LRNKEIYFITFGHSSKFRVCLFDESTRQVALKLSQAEFARTLVRGPSYAPG